jgi:hypothetical protein
MLYIYESRAISSDLWIAGGDSVRSDIALAGGKSTRPGPDAPDVTLDRRVEAASTLVATRQRFLVPASLK